MTTLKCKMCGGDLSFNEGAMTCECEYCGSVNTLPALDNREQRANLYNRANRLRMQCEFDKALSAYEKILDQDNADAEAHWGAVLSRWGIEYVKDPVNGERKPTCHRVQMQSILTDVDYRAAIEHAPDRSTKETYEAEARRIAEIQKDILAISQQEKPYDVFICYKETDENGQRTKDSTLAQDIYYQLTNDGYKVFFSRITLEDKLGQQYEPYIFAALNSAKVMLVIGTKPEYFEAVWVKNEWSRYLHLMQNDRSRLLIPCYRDMDPYDLPEALSNLQSQDMSKIGFMQDILRGVKKILDVKKENQQTVIQQVQVVPQQAAAGNATVESLMKRAKLFMEDGDFGSANEYLDKVLDIDPEYAPAYLGKVQAKLKLHKEDQLGQTLEQYESSNDWKKALRFATPEQKELYQRYLVSSKDARDNNRKQGIYNKAIQVLNNATTIDNVSNCYDAQKLFLSIAGFKDADAKAQHCETRANEIKYDYAAEMLKRAKTAEECENAAKKFREIRLFKDAQVQIKACEQKAHGILQREYERALDRLNNATTIEDYGNALIRFKALGNFCDSAEKAKEAEKKKNALEEQIRAEKERIQEEENRHALEAKKRIRTRNIILTCSAALVFVAVILFVTVIKPANDYKRAQHAFASGDYDVAAYIWNDLGDYKDSLVMRQESLYREGIQYMEKGEYDNAASIFNQIISYKDSEMQFQNAKLTVGKAFLEQGDRIEALLAFRDAGFNAEAMRLANKIQSSTILSFSDHIVGLKNDGTVLAKDEETVYDSRYDVSGGPCDVSTWSDIVGLAGDDYCTIGIKNDGSVVAAGYDVDVITDISNVDTIAVCIEPRHFIVLMKDGTVSDIFPPEEQQYLENAEEYLFSVNEWSNIVDISVGYGHVVGLESNGTVVATGDNKYGQCDVEDWTDIVSVYASYYGTVGLKADGTLVVAGEPSSYAWDADDVVDWSDILSISVPSDGSYIVGLKADGTVVKRGGDFTSGIQDWSDIVMIKAGTDYCVAVQRNGRVLDEARRSIYNIMSFVSGWRLW